MPGSVFVTLYGSSTYNVIRSCQIAFQISYIILHTHQSCMKDALTLHPCQYLMFKHLIFFLKLISPLCRMFEGEDMFKLVLCIGWDGWMASPSQWTWVWLDPGSWWWTGKSGMLQSTGLQSWIRLNNWTELNCSWPRDQTRISCVSKWILYCWATREALFTHLTHLISSLCEVVLPDPLIVHFNVFVI